jgi:hypothetical protein
MWLDESTTKSRQMSRNRKIGWVFHGLCGSEFPAWDSGGGRPVPVGPTDIELEATDDE